MDIRRYCFEFEMTYKQLAAEIHYAPITIRMAASGKIKPGRKLIERLEDFSQGMITREDLLQKYSEKNKD